jgi:hypothetical protein
VVEILDNGQLRLVSESPDGLYAALSYCWGGPQSFQTTRDTLVTKCEIFSANELPKTLQDAVLLTQKLGLRHLWVDSLCIVQDDDEDKAKELARMAEYYSNAHITICAAGEKCTSGFLAAHSGCDHHPESKLPNDLLHLRVLDETDTVRTLLFRPETPLVRRSDGIEQRAWTLQERVLSPRVLFYGSQRTTWQCSSKSHGDGGNDNGGGYHDGFDYQKLHRALRLGKEAVAGRDVIDLGQLLNMWYQAVEEYTHRAVTNRLDKLLAISALASRLREVVDSHNVAGLWNITFIQDLLW